MCEIIYGSTGSMDRILCGGAMGRYEQFLTYIEFQAAAKASYPAFVARFNLSRGEARDLADRLREQGADVTQPESKSVELLRTEDARVRAEFAVAVDTVGSDAPVSQPDGDSEEAH